MSDLIKLRLGKFGMRDYSLWGNPDDYGLSVELAEHGFREPLNTYYFASLLKKLNVERSDIEIVDVGGNIGYFPVIEGLCFDGKISVIEPVGDSFGYLVRNVAGFRNIRAMQFAVGAESGFGWMNVCDKRNWSQLVVDDGKCYHFDDFCGFERVHVLSLEDVLACRDDVLLRFDVEGSEVDILSSIPDCVSYLVFELHPSILGAGVARELLGDVKNAGFELFLLLSDIGSQYYWLFKRFGMFGGKLYNVWSKCIYVKPDAGLLADKIEEFAVRGICPHCYFRRVDC